MPYPFVIRLIINILLFILYAFNWQNLTSKKKKFRLSKQVKEHIQEIEPKRKKALEVFKAFYFNDYNFCYSNFGISVSFSFYLRRRSREFNY